MTTIEEARQYVGTTPLSGLAQMAVLLSYGLSRDDHFGEIGCGALHLAKPLAPWLRSGHYCGMDPATWLRAAALDNDGILAASLRQQGAEFSGRSDFDLLDAFNRRFDVIFAHSVLSHASHGQLLDCLLAIERALTPNGVAVVTLNIARDGRPPTMTSEWQYPQGCTVAEAELQNAIGVAGLTGTADTVARAVYMSWCPVETHDWVVLRRSTL